MLFTWQCLIQSIVLMGLISEYWCPCKRSECLCPVCVLACLCVIRCYIVKSGWAGGRRKLSLLVFNETFRPLVCLQEGGLEELVLPCDARAISCLSGSGQHLFTKLIESLDPVWLTGTHTHTHTHTANTADPCQTVTHPLTMFRLNSIIFISLSAHRDMKR